MWDLIQLILYTIFFDIMAYLVPCRYNLEVHLLHFYAMLGYMEHTGVNSTLYELSIMLNLHVLVMLHCVYKESSINMLYDPLLI